MGIKSDNYFGGSNRRSYADGVCWHLIAFWRRFKSLIRLDFAWAQIWKMKNATIETCLEKMKPALLRFMIWIYLGLLSLIAAKAYIVHLLIWCSPGLSLVEDNPHERNLEFFLRLQWLKSELPNQIFSKRGLTSDLRFWLAWYRSIAEKIMFLDKLIYITQGLLVI